MTMPLHGSRMWIPAIANRYMHLNFVTMQKCFGELLPSGEFALLSALALCRTVPCTLFERTSSEICKSGNRAVAWLLQFIQNRNRASSVRSNCMHVPIFKLWSLCTEQLRAKIYWLTTATDSRDIPCFRSWKKNVKPEVHFTANDSLFHGFSEFSQNIFHSRKFTCSCILVASS